MIVCPYVGAHAASALNKELAAARDEVDDDAAVDTESPSAGQGGGRRARSKNSARAAEISSFICSVCFDPC